MFEDIDKPVTLSLVSRGCEVIHVPRSRFQEMCNQQSLTHILLKCIKTYPGKISTIETHYYLRKEYVQFLLSKIWNGSRIKKISWYNWLQRHIPQVILKPNCEVAQILHVT